MKLLYALCLTLACLSLSAQTAPVPYLSQALSPPSIAPGGNAFTLTVYGAGFAPTAIVNWNGSTRATSVLSNRELRAYISAADVATASTAWITVTNPGGGTSNTVFLPITQPIATIGMAIKPDFLSAGSFVAGDFNNDGKLDVDQNGSIIYLGNGKGGFASPIISQVANGVQLFTGDFNGDGHLDVAEVDVGGLVHVLLGAGNGTLTNSWTYQARGGGNAIAVGDFNQDGHLDLYITGYDLANSWFGIAVGRGDGTFSSPGQQEVGYYAGTPAIGDFNGDGLLDLAIPESGHNAIDIFLGNGSGGFNEIGSFFAGVIRTAFAADMNHDGILDLVTDSGCVYLGDGNGNFTASGCGYYSGFNSAGIGDFDGNGNLDVANMSTQGFSLLMALDLGAGDGTFLPSSPSFLLGTVNGNVGMGAVGDFNNDGLLDVVANGYLALQAPIDLQPLSLSFGNQNVGTASTPQSANLTNVGTTPLAVRIGIAAPSAGLGAANFTETNNCGSSLPAGSTCTIMITFQPRIAGTFTPLLEVEYPGVGSPQQVALSGTGLIAPWVSLLPASLTFPVQVYGMSSQPQSVTLTNVGGQPLQISNIAITGAFNQTNNCPPSLPAGSGCTFQIVFTPTGAGALNGTLSLTDNATGSPQVVSLSGTGTVVVFSPIAVNFGNQKVGVSSPSIPITLNNVGPQPLTINGIGISGLDSGDFMQNNNCGGGVPANSSCTINVVFTPQAKGQRSASVAVTDSGGASPQSVPLSGTGT